MLSLLLILFIVPPGKAEKKIIIRENTTAEYQSSLGAYYWQKGDFAKAIEAWSVEAEIYRSQGLPNYEAEAMLKIAQANISMGQIEIAIIQLKKIVSSHQEPSLLARAWNKLGKAYSRSGEWDEALSAYKQSLELDIRLLVLNNLVLLQKKQVKMAQLKANSAKEGEDRQGYLAEAEEYRSDALKYGESALLLSQTEESPASVTALIEWAELSPTGLNLEQLERGRKILALLPSSRTKVYLGINWAKLDSEQAEYWLSQAGEVAKEIGDVVAESYVLLELGLLAEQSGKSTIALDYAYTAQLKAQSKFAFDSLYRSQWLAARIHQETGKTEAAISSYREAIASLDHFNQNTRNIDVERRLSFNQEIEPIYREMLKLLLAASNPDPSDLQSALFVLDKLRLAQLQNYFGDNCLEINRDIASIHDLLAEKNAVMISSVILENSTNMFLQLPDGTLHHHSANLTQTEITKLVTQWYKILKQGHSVEYRTKSSKLYNLILRPFETELEKINPNTIVFVHDGVLRNIPMAALYDGEKHLAEKWASVSSLGLDFRFVPQSQKAKVAAFGLSVEREGWSSLPSVPVEVENVTKIVKGQKFLDSDFTSGVFNEQLGQELYSIIHIATHGRFGGVAENSFILAYDKSLNALELEDALSQSEGSINLLVFSACETAVGSDFSALGLAGVGLRSGASSVLGTYWAVKDSPHAALIKEFYFNVFEKKLDKAEALRQVQVKQIQETAFPDIWGTLNLIGDW